jgi:hypothetical protein
MAAVVKAKRGAGTLDGSRTNLRWCAPGSQRQEGDQQEQSGQCSYFYRSPPKTVTQSQAAEALPDAIVQRLPVNVLVPQAATMATASRLSAPANRAQ